MLPSPDNAEHTRVDHVVQKRSALPFLGLAAAVLAAGWFVLSSASSPESASPATSSTVPSEPTPSIVVTTQPTPTPPPVLEGRLLDGRPFAVRERTVGALCAQIGNEPADAVDGANSIEICHAELPTASGARLHNDVLIFGYLVPGSTDVALRYRQNGTSSEGALADPDTRFFAIPIRQPDLYRLQYRSELRGVIAERSMVPLTGEPSQTPEAAARDGVAADVAALPYNRRVDVEIENTQPDEGPWVVSTALRLREDQGCLGDADADGTLGPQPCRQRESEILLLNNTGSAVERAYPLPGLTPLDLWVYDEAIYVVGRIGVADGLSENDSFIARVDRADFTFRIESFPGIRIDDLGETPDGILRLNFDGGVGLDPVTLQRVS